MVHALLPRVKVPWVIILTEPGTIALWAAQNGYSGALTQRRRSGTVTWGSLIKGPFDLNTAPLPLASECIPDQFLHPRLLLTRRTIAPEGTTPALCSASSAGTRDENDMLFALPLRVA